ncbi:inositol transport system permease protein [Klebsiella pneumoniae]|nr:inositol transport system permease protein [Klebsiella pneumoniae]
MVMHEGRITGILKKTKPTRKPFCRWHPIEAQRMSNMKLTAAPASEGSSFFANLRHKNAERYRHLVVMLVIALTFEIAGWYVRDHRSCSIPTGWC